MPQKLADGMNLGNPSRDSEATRADQLAIDGCTVIRGALSSEAVAAQRDLLGSRLDAASLRSQGVVVAARNLLELCPEIADQWRTTGLVDLLMEILGPECGLVRGLYFDKPPERSWGLPWHRDRTIAVKAHRDPADPFSKPTIKEGVPHVEATTAILDRMLTLRFHLDDTDADNGALRVIPGSHRIEENCSAEMVIIEAAAGDCLAMRPLLSHSSGPATEGSMRHRRIVHLEFAAEERLPAGYDWHEFRRVRDQ